MIGMRLNVYRCGVLGLFAAACLLAAPATVADLRRAFERPPDDARMMVRAVLERLYEAELDHLHELEEKYHAHLDREVVELSANHQNLLSNWLFKGIEV